MLFYLILAHNNLDQLELLVKKIKTNNSEIFIHMDKKIKEFPKIENVYYIEQRQSISWGGFSMIKAELSGIREIYKYMKEGDHIVIISGQCYPIKPMQYVEKYISNLKNRSCVYYDPTPNKNKWKVDRYHFLDLKLRIPKRMDEGIYAFVEIFYKKIGKPHRVPALNAILYILANLILPRRTYITKQYVIYSGSQRMVLSYQHIKRVLKFLDSSKGKKILSHFKMTSCSDEIFFQTILLNNDKGDEINNESLRYIIQEGKYTNSPRILTINDFDNMQKSSKLFARKFDINKDKKVLDALSEIR